MVINLIFLFYFLCSCRRNIGNLAKTPSKENYHVLKTFLEKIDRDKFKKNVVDLHSYMHSLDEYKSMISAETVDQFYLETSRLIQVLFDKINIDFAYLDENTFTVQNNFITLKHFKYKHSNESIYTGHICSNDLSKTYFHQFQCSVFDYHVVFTNLCYYFFYDLSIEQVDLEEKGAFLINLNFIINQIIAKFSSFYTIDSFDDIDLTVFSYHKQTYNWFYFIALEDTFYDLFDDLFDLRLSFVIYSKISYVRYNKYMKRSARYLQLKCNENDCVCTYKDFKRVLKKDQFSSTRKRIFEGTKKPHEKITADGRNLIQQNILKVFCLIVYNCRSSNRAKSVEIAKNDEKYFNFDEHNEIFPEEVVEKATKIFSEIKNIKIVENNCTLNKTAIKRGCDENNQAAVKIRREDENVFNVSESFELEFLDANTPLELTLLEIDQN